MFALKIFCVTYSYLQTIRRIVCKFMHLLPNCCVIFPLHHRGLVSGKPRFILLPVQNLVLQSGRHRRPVLLGPVLQPRVRADHVFVSLFNHDNRSVLDCSHLPHVIPYANSGNLEVTTQFLTEIDKLIQLIESPIFACKFTRPRAHRLLASNFKISG